MAVSGTTMALLRSFTFAVGQRFRLFQLLERASVFENVELDESKLDDVSAEMFQRIDEQARSHIEMFHVLGDWVDCKRFRFFGICDYASSKGYFVVQYSVDISAAKPEAAVERVIGWVADGELDRYTGSL